MGQHNQFAQVSKMQIAIQILVISVCAILLAVLQVTLLAKFQLLGVTPDLILIFVLCTGFFMGRYTGAIVGIGAGFLIESVGGVGMTLLPLFYLFLGYVAGYFARTVYEKRFFTYGIYLSATLLYHVAITILDIALTHQAFHLGSILIRVVLPEAVMTGLWGMILYFPLKWMFGKLEKIK